MSGKNGIEKKHILFWQLCCRGIAADSEGIVQNVFVDKENKMKGKDTDVSKIQSGMVKTL